MKKNILIALLLAFGITSCKEKAKEEAMEEGSVEMETPAQDTTEENWIVLFDGTSFDAWKEYGKEGVSENWKIEDGAMVFYPPVNGPEGVNYNLVSKEEFENFVLSFDWKISEGGNSGVFWGIREIEGLGQPYETGPEIQVLDNEKHPDAKAGTTHQAGALYDMVSPSADVTNAVGEWNSMEITINYKEEMGKVVLNGTEVVTFPLGNGQWDAMVSDSKFKDWEHFGKYHKGKIGLQDHGNMVAFRNIKLKPL